MTKPAANTVERRVVTFTDLEVRGLKSDEGAPVIEGHAAVFNQWSEPLFGFREKVAPGAFKKTLKEADVRALYNHDSNYVIGRNKAGTLELKEDDEGLFTRMTPPDTQWARDLMTSMQRGDVDQMSFGFQTVRDRWSEDETERTLLEVKLFDVSVVTYPAYPQTSVQVNEARQLMAANGFDLDALIALFARDQRGIARTAADHELVKGSINALQTHLPSAPLKEHPDETPVHAEPKEREVLHSLARARRRLEIAELALI